MVGIRDVGMLQRNGMETARQRGLKNYAGKLLDGILVTSLEVLDLLVFMVSLDSPFPKLNWTN